MRAILAMLLLSGPILSGPVFADPLTAEAFDALTFGRTMTWAEFGQVYGVEQYLPGRKVRWTFVGDDCRTGHWYPQDGLICFRYDTDPEPDCWEITQADGSLHARFAGAGPDTAPVVVTETTAPLACPGPEVGA